MRLGFFRRRERAPADVVGAIAEYAAVLNDALVATHNANLRPMITGHLAEVARLLAIVYDPSGQGPSRTAKWVEGESHAFGWSYLPDSEGEAITKAFVKLQGVLNRYVTR